MSTDPRRQELRHLTRRWALLVFVLLGIFVAAGCARAQSDPELSALKADAMASWAPSGAGVVEEYSTSSRDQSNAQKPRLASVVRLVSLGGGSLDAAVAEGERAARDAGWTRTDDSDARFTRPGDGFTMTLSILSGAEADQDLTVTLTAVPS